MARPHPLRRALLAGAVAAFLPASPFAATTPGEIKDVAMRLTATGTVVAIDPAARRLTLQGARGTATYRIDPKVQQLDAIKVGDRVKIDYVAALAMTLKRGGKEAQEAAEREAQERATAAPGAVVATGSSVVAKVLAVDRAKQSVRLKGPEGRVSDFRVQDPADLVGVRPGDQVAAVLHEAVVVGLEPASR